mgnify:CR=1 FL=1|tara:strand:+ start:139 stop:531 length:393 start_codon:yes stop_codon:yes gene_type:complete
MTVNFTFWLILCLIISLIVNILGVWYIRKIVSRLTFVNENIDDLGVLIESYQNHLTGIFSLEQYYGDQDIKNLLDHTRSLKAVLDEYSDVSILLEEPQEYDENEEGDTEDAPPPIDQENVFYAGTRASNN